MELVTLHRVCGYLGLLLFVVATTIGLGMEFGLWHGAIGLGITSGIAAYLLGSGVDGGDN